MKNIALVVLCILALSSCGSGGAGTYDFTGMGLDEKIEAHYMQELQEQERSNEELRDANDRVEELESELYDANERIAELEMQIERMNYNVLPEEANYIGDLLTNQFHNMLCDLPKDEEYCTYFWTREDAINEGMSPCQVCMP